MNLKKLSKNLDKLIQEEELLVHSLKTNPVATAEQLKYNKTMIPYHKGKREAYEHVRRIMG